MSSPGYFRDLQNRLKKFVESGQLGRSATPTGATGLQAAARGEPDGGGALSRGARLQKEIVKIQAIFGGRNPHPNWLVGGVPSPINLNDTGAVGAVNMERFEHGRLDHRPHIEFIDNVYIPDLLAIASFYKDWRPSAADCRRST